MLSPTQATFVALDMFAERVSVMIASDIIEVSLVFISTPVELLTDRTVLWLKGHILLKLTDFGLYLTVNYAYTKT